MKRLLILGAGTAGTMMANKLNAALDPMDWEITIVDENETHYYQPGFLFIPFGIYKKKDVIKPKRNFLPSGVKVEFAGIEVIEPEKQKVSLNNGKKLNYDYLIIATGCDVHPEETEGMDGDAWKEVLSFEGNYHRRRTHKLDMSVESNEIRIEVVNTHGCKSARIYEVRVYS